jgi:hypothetical protein
MERPSEEMFGQILRAIVREEVARALEVERGPVEPVPPRPQASRAPNSGSPPPGLDPFDRVGFAEHVLRAAGGGPLHAGVIAERMYESGYRHRRPPKYRDQLVRSVNSLASPSQHPDVFKRVGPRTLELV